MALKSKQVRRLSFWITMQFLFTLFLLVDLRAGDYLWVGLNTLLVLWVSWEVFGLLNDWDQPGRTREQLLAWVTKKKDVN
jgi:hypothetical protein